jgi:uncharacterized protein YjbJ (UPF0337 family)
MTDRIEELQGQIKKGIGSLTGNDEMKREGEAQEQTAKLKREAEGAVDQAAGKAQESVGDATDDLQTELEGKVRQAEGDIERTG